jgi:hypothetical protein|nr:MAG TPA: DNA binding protein [Crassvirales sp.]
MSTLSRFNAKDHPELIVTREDIINTIQENILDGEIINDVIENVEKQIRSRAESLRRVSIPYIGSIVPNENKLDIIEHRELMQSKQRELTKEQYQKFKSDFIRSRFALRKGMRSKRIVTDKMIRLNSKRAARMFRTNNSDKHIRTYFYFLAFLKPVNYIPND